MTAPDRLVVLQSVPPPGPRTNPYVLQLVEATRRGGATVEWFGWRRALFGRYDVLHLHWPETMLRRRGRPARAAAYLRTLLLQARVALTRTPVVRTLHNERPHEEGGWLERHVLAGWDRLVGRWILLNPTTIPPRPRPASVIPHGHYEDWFASLERGTPVPGRLLFFGLLRPMKGVDLLLGAFADTTVATLRIVGSPHSPGMRELVDAAVARDPRVTARVEYVDDVTLAAEIGAAELVVLPYRSMGNSGAALLALSLGRPVLVPDSPVSRELRAEVGAEWVRLLDGPLDATRLEAALGAALPAGGPDLSARDWPLIAEAHLRCYEAARDTRAPAVSAR